MPIRVPVYERQVGLPAAAPSVQASPGAFAAQPGALQDTGRALQRLGAEVSRVDQLRQQQADAAKEIELEAQIMGGLGELELAAQNDTDFENALGKFDKQAQELKTRVLAQTTSETVRQRVDLGFQKLVTTKRLKISSDAREKQASFYRARGEELTDQYARAAAMAGTEAEYQDAVQRGENVIAILEAQGYLDPEEAVKRLRGFRESRASLAAQQDIFAAPEEAARRLLSDPGYLPDISPEKRQRLIETATNRANAEITRREVEANRAERAAEKADKLRYVETQKRGDELLASGALTPDWVMENRDNLDAADYRFFLTKLTIDKPERTDPDIYISLMDAAAAGESDAIERANNAYRKGFIKREDRDRVETRFQKQAGVADMPSWFKTGEAYIKGSLRVSDLNPDPAQAQRQADAYDDWIRWAERNPTATRAEAEGYYKKLVEDYKFIELDLLMTERKPTFLVGSRNDPQTIDIAATARRTMDEFTAKHGGDTAAVVADPDFQDQMRIINDWRVKLERLSPAGAQ